MKVLEKVLERLVLAHLRPQLEDMQDPLQFAYRPHVGVENAITYVLQRAHSHLDGGAGSVRVMFPVPSISSNHLY